MEKKVSITSKNYSFDIGRLIDKMNCYLYTNIRWIHDDRGDIERQYEGRDIRIALAYRDVECPANATLTLNGRQEEIETLEKSLTESKFIVQAA